MADGAPRSPLSDSAGTRQNARFIGELTKFAVIPPATTFSVMKTLLDDFTPGSVEAVCHLLETCGRFLHRLPSTSVRMSNLVRVAPPLCTALGSGCGLTRCVQLSTARLVRATAGAAHAQEERPPPGAAARDDGRECVLHGTGGHSRTPKLACSEVNRTPRCARFCLAPRRRQTNPPDQAPQLVKQRPLILEYIRYLLFTKLSEPTLEDVLDCLRRLPRKEPQASSMPL